MTWRFYREGSYNLVYKQGDLIFKKPKPLDDTTAETLNKDRIILALDEPERAVRLWNTVNTAIEPKAYVHADPKLGKGWICPFIQGEQASDEEVFLKVIHLFNTTGRIIVDATSPGNFIKTADGDIVCLDFGWVLQLEADASRNYKEHTRRNSITSINAWKIMSREYVRFLNDARRHFQTTVPLILALLFIKSYCANIYSVNFLKNHQEMIDQLASKFAALVNLSPNAKNKKTIEALIDEGKTELEQLIIKHNYQECYIPPELESAEHYVNDDLDKIKSHCIVELTRYINSRGEFGDHDRFFPSLTTNWFRNVNLTSKKVLSARKLIQSINKASSIEHIKRYISEAQEVNNQYKTTCITRSHLGLALTACLNLIDFEDIDYTSSTELKSFKV